MRVIDIFKLAGSIFLDTKDAEKGIDGIAKKSEGLGGKLGGAAKTVGKWGLAIGAGAVAGATALTALVMKTTAVGDNIHKHSQKVGMSTTAYQEWDYVLGQNGISMDGMDRYMRKVDESMRVGTDGVVKGKGAYDKLGISLENTNGTMKTQEEVFDDVITGLQGMDEGTERNSIAAELLGSKYAELNPLLNGTAEETEALKAGLHEMGGVMSEDAVNAAADFNDQMDDLKRGFEGVFREIATAVMPIFSELVSWITANMPKIKETMSTVFEAIGTIIQVVVGIFREVLIPTFSAIVDAVKLYFPMVQDTIQTVTDKIMSIVNVFVDIFKKFWSMYGEYILDITKSVWDLIKTVFDTITKVIKGVIDDFIKVFQMVWNKYGENITKSIQITWDLIRTVFNAALDLIKGIVDAFIALFKGDWSAFGEAIKGIIETAWNLIKDVFSLAIQSIKNIMDAAITTLKNVATSIMTAVWDAFKAVWRSLTGWIGEIFPNLGTTISGFASSFAASGRAIFTGVWDGMKGIWGSITGWVNDKVTWLKDKLSFWKKSEAEMSTSSVASNSGYSQVKRAGKTGISNIPYDGFKVLAHKGEKLLNREDAKAYEQGENRGGKTINIVLDNAKIYDTRSIKEVSRDLATQISREVSFG